jgi:hypothetical protein
MHNIKAMIMKSCKSRKWIAFRNPEEDLLIDSPLFHVISTLKIIRIEAKLTSARAGQGSQEAKATRQWNLE